MKNEILSEIQFNEETGSLIYKEVCYILIRSDVLATLQRSIEKELGDRASHILFDCGFQGGSLSSRKFRDIFKLSEKETLKFMLMMGTRIGWGRFELAEFDPLRNYISIKVFHSPFAKAYGISNRPVCHLIRGVISGLVSTTLGKNVEAEELLCLSKGDDFCLFEIKQKNV